MDQILEVNEKLAYAVIEPGVTYEQFNHYLKQHGYRLWIDCTDGPPLGSVVGNALDRGIGETPYGDHFGNLCGMEVVLPNGEVIHTGGSSPHHPVKTWHTYKWGLGPYIEGLFTQSNFGIVTKVGIWLLPEPEAYNSYIFELANNGNLGPVIDRFRELALQGIVSSKLHLVSDFVSLTILTQKMKEALPPGHIRKEELEKLRRKFGFAIWSGGAALYGNKKQVAIQKKILRREFPSEDVDPSKDGVGLTWFAPILPFTSEDVVPYLTESRTIFEKYGFDFYMAMLMLNPRSIICLMGILFDKRNSEEVQKAQELYDEMFDKLNSHNYQQYRTGIACWDRIWRESPELSEFYSLIKSAIDPNQILAPGKYGIN